MHEYDIALKSILTRRGGTVLEALTGFAVTRWCNSELPKVTNRRVDLLGETSDDRLVHIELQSTNDADMALRMAEYAWAIYRRFRRFPEQVVLYVGEAPLRMRDELAGGTVSVKYRQVDSREFDAEPLLASESLEDNLIAVLLRSGDEREAVRRILRRIAEGDSSSRGTAIAELTILAGLRSLEAVIEEESQQMPILTDIMDHKIIGRERRRGMEIGRQEGERGLVLRMVEKRFGAVPSWARQRLESMSLAEVEDAGMRLLDVSSFEELLP